MKKSLILVVLMVSAVLVSACGFSNFTFNRRVLRGSGDVVSENREVSGFDKIRVEGFGELHLEQGESESLKINAEDNLIDKIETKVEGNTLVISYEKSILDWNVIPTEPIEFHVTVTQLDEIEIDGAASVVAEEWQAESLEFEINGVADIDLDDVKLGVLELRLNGGGDFNISGEASEISIRVDGAGSVDLDNLESRDVEITINGAAEVHVWATETLDIEINGAGSVHYYGNPHVTQNIDGIGSVRSLGSK